VKHQDELLRAAQDVVNDAREVYADADGPEDGGHREFVVDAETFDNLRAVVQKIHDDVVEVIKAMYPVAGEIVKHGRS